MGRKKRKEVKAIFCYYCDRDFDDEKTLVDHQKAKHFKCACWLEVVEMLLPLLPHHSLTHPVPGQNCNKKMSTAKSLLGHTQFVHKVVMERCVGVVGAGAGFPCLTLPFLLQCP